MKKGNLIETVKRCRDCRFNHNDGTSMDSCHRDQMLKWEADPPQAKPDYVRGGVIGFAQTFILDGSCQPNREDPAKCGPDVRWFEAA